MVLTTLEYLDSREIWPSEVSWKTKSISIYKFIVESKLSR